MSETGIEAKIFRPVSLPEQFVGAPILPAILNLMVCVIIFMVASIFEFQAPVIIILGAIIIHMLLIRIGATDPHITTIMKTHHISRRRYKTLISKKDLDLYP